MKKMALIFIALILVILIVPAILPSKFSMSRSIEINAPVNLVFTKLADLNEYAKWNPFQDGDSSHTNEVFGAGVGSYLTWKGEKSGEGKMTITDLQPNNDITFKMEFYKPMPGEGEVHWITKQKTDNSTEMAWTFVQDLSYFMRYFGLVMEGMMGKHFEKGLANFKSQVEAAK